jgi:delta 1-pyrroline-5-carboxylate dehydrogenase
MNGRHAINRRKFCGKATIYRGCDLTRYHIRRKRQHYQEDTSSMPLHYIDGQFTNGKSKETIDVIDPASEAVIESVPRGTEADAHAAVAAAKRAFGEWRRTSANVRATMLHEAAQKMREHKDEIVRLLTLEEGKPVPENEEEFEWLCTTFDYYAELGRHERGRVLPSGEYSQLNLVLKEPYGVAACIVPWNYPLLLLAWKMAPALAAGNTVIIKSSELTPLSTMYLAQKCWDHFPRGVINVVHGLGPEVAEPLVLHNDVPVIAFTGSLQVGQRIASLAGPKMKKLHLELGGKDAFVVSEDAEPEMTARFGVCSFDELRASLHVDRACVFAENPREGIYGSAGRTRSQVEVGTRHRAFDGCGTDDRRSISAESGAPHRGSSWKGRQSLGWRKAPEAAGEGLFPRTDDSDERQSFNADHEGRNFWSGDSADGIWIVR